MSPSNFLRLLNNAKRLPEEKRARAIEALVQEAKAITTMKHGKFIGWQLPGGFVCRKQRYKDRETAIDAVIEIHRVNHEPDGPSDAYKCESCTGWHITTSRIAAQRNRNNLQSKERVHNGTR